MLSLNDIINASFRKSGFSGYRTDDVDQFIDEVKESYDTLLKKQVEQKEEYEKLKSENEQLIEKLKILAAKVEDYRKEENEIKNALVSAQKLGDASIRESRHKAEIIIKDANLKAERIVSTAKQSVIEQQKELENLQKSVSDFRSKLLSLYKEHLTLIDALPTHKPAQENPEPPKHAAKEDFPEQEELSPAPKTEEQPLEEEETAQQPDDFLHAEVSIFDEDPQDPSFSYAPKYSEEFHASDDPISPENDAD
ncbi:DivIVA domain-containing protein [Caproiciproducens galactitolivorans]|uniref:Septum site-determining protein DivIVA n=1 Tax=Caproiciproducens galactitolivorans TaxID=642589 RepID=A0A4Z0Y2B2_9FIRM|nr:DivIVA domain-containing protein [Caproiciproducens galactitolivorans]QEY34177.1 DivIVA domain-containing protein [Caproiciproducens galactitolivorans]TGJ78069.1 septum site-determining protein DivIVA [Caproiciproducens galactitolivorans]